MTRRHIARTSGIPILLGLVVSSCTGAEKPAEHVDNAAYWAHSPAVCQIDEVREYACEELLPRESALPAPPPYESCPAKLEGHVGVLDPTPPVAVFDSDYTEYMRKRAPPGHQCCYGWCSLVTVADPRGLTGREGCEQPRAFRETFCMSEPESGTSAPVAPPYQRCPSAISPPPGVVFQAPRAALFDRLQTDQRRAQGFGECCYGWCSLTPPGAPVPRR